MYKKILLILTIPLVLIQFFQIDKKSQDNIANPINSKYSIPLDVSKILENACYNCHSNNIKYPWYSSVQPLGWWLQGHINEGKEELNFSNFTNRTIARQNHKFEEIIEQVKEHNMPLSSYTYFGLHPEAKLTEDQRTALITWTQLQMEIISNQYPPDSLVLEKRNN